MTVYALGCSIACAALSLDAWWSGQPVQAVALALAGGVGMLGVMVFG